MHFDHIHPKSKGGTSDAGNCQILSPEANIAKSNNTIEFRQWQKEFRREWMYHKHPDPFLCVACPGAGKTIAALSIARNWLDSCSDARVLICVPTDNLRTQWSKDAVRFYGVELQRKDFGSNFKHGFQGGVFTYQSLDSLCQLLRMVTAKAPTLVILDEPHHLGESRTWANNAKTAFEPAKRMLLLSGTPFRTDRTPIPFIRYDGNGVAVPTYKYDYPDALQDNVVRYLSFDYSAGKYETADLSGERLEYELNKDTSKSEAEKRLSKLLRPDGAFVEALITAADTKLNQVRRTVPDAAGLIACMDQRDATQIAKLVERISGESPSVIVSDEDKTNDSVENFRNGSSKWLIAVRKVAEGTDIKRLQVLCYLTSTTSDMFFRQLVGRVSRVRNLNDHEAYVFLPSDPRLIDCAKNLELAQEQALKAQDDEVSREIGERTPDEYAEIFMGSEHMGTDFAIIGREEFSPEVARLIRESARVNGVSDEMAARFYHAFSSPNQQPDVRIQSSDDVETLEDRMQKVRDEVKTIGRKLAGRLKQRGSSLEYGEICSRIFGHWPTPVKHMSLAQLTEMKVALAKSLAKGEMP